MYQGMKLSDIKITVLHLRSKNVLTCTSPIKTEWFRTLGLTVNDQSRSYTFSHDRSLIIMIVSFIFHDRILYQPIDRTFVSG